jgi:hypothetical protein
LFDGATFFGKSKGTIMKKQYALLSAAVFAIGASIGMSAQAEPPPWASAHGHRAHHHAREYNYVYYPAQQVYYAPTTQTWFWANGGNWQFGISLPVQYRGYVRNEGIPVMLHSPRPYVEHVYVEEHYGRPWREAHEHRKGYERHSDRDDRHGHRDHDRR